MDTSATQSFVQVFIKDIKTIIYYLWTREKKLKLIDGLLTKESLIIFCKRVKKNLKYELRQAYEDFIKQRTKAGASDYQRVIINFNTSFSQKKNEVFDETLKNFGITKDIFIESCEKYSEDLEIIDLLKSIKNITIKSEVMGPGLDQLNTIIFTQDYIQKMQEQLNIDNQITSRYRILDDLKLKYGTTELDLYLAFHLHQHHPAISQMHASVLDLESKFDKLE